ncbi:MAG TPA: CAP domain-containing protein [Enhygromyxa sp.]|nr:CAP domain-containing protein [Enhygromyxa sp.]
MRRSILVTGFVLITTACAAPTQPSGSANEITHADQHDPPSTPTSTPPPTSRDPFADAFVDAHNRHRASVSPPADPPLPPVAWSDELAATAQAWARRCEFRHSQTDYGENLGARTDQADPAAMVAEWASEAAHYDHRRDRCASGQVCGHYTQMVWRDSTTIGCGVAQCSGGGPFGGGEWFLWVCNYAPPGNWKGQRPY